jgi:hypothetical protein
MPGLSALQGPVQARPARQPSAQSTARLSEANLFTVDREPADHKPDGQARTLESRLTGSVGGGITR